MRGWWNRIPWALRYVLLLFLVTRVVLSGVGAAARTYLPPSANAPFELHETGVPALDTWGVFDSGWYLRIARDGYVQVSAEEPDARYPFAFAPLYPLLIRAVAFVLPSEYLAALAVSNLALLGAALLLHNLVSRRWGERTARRAVLLLFLFPTGFYLSGALSESLFLVLVLASLSAADRKQWVLAAALAGLAALTRYVGVVLLVPLAVQYVREQHPGWNLLAFALIPIALLPFFLYAGHVTGDTLAPLHAHGLPPWDRHFGNPITNLAHGYTLLYVETQGWASVGLATIVGILALGPTIGWVWTLTGLALVLAPLSTGIMSLLRLASVQFVFPAGLARVMAGRRFVVLAVACAALQIVLMALWATADQLTV